MPLKRRRLQLEFLEHRRLLTADLSLIRYFDTWGEGTMGSTDPAGLTYHPGLERLYVADSEINELNEHFTGENIFEVSLLGDVTHRAIVSGNTEPTGITYNEFDGYFYITNDDTKSVVRYDANLNSPLASVDTRAAVPSASDPEGIASDPATGALYVVDGKDGGLQVLVYNSDLQFQYHFPISNVMSDGEGIALDPVSGNLLIVSAKNQGIFEFDVTGIFVGKYDLDGFTPGFVAPEGIVFAPTSDPLDDAAALSLYIADGMVDNHPDGRIYEMHISRPLPGTETIRTRVATSSDDAEERASGWITTDNPDLELVDDASNQTVGIRFADLGIPRGATILNAYVQFQVDEATVDGASLKIQGESVDDAATFTTSSGSISSRPRTAASVAWAPAAWDKIGSAHFDQRTPDLSSVIQELVSRPGWAVGNALALIFSGIGTRVAESFDGDPAGAPLLHIQYVPPSEPQNVAPVVDAGVDEGVTLPNSLNLSGSVSDDGLPGAPLTTVWSQVSGPGTTTFGDASLLQTTASFSLPGVYVLRLTASDSELSSFDELTVTVAEANVAPVVDAGVDGEVTLPNSLNLSGSVSDDGLPGAPLTSVWSQVSGPGTTTFGDASLLQTTASFSLPGVYVLRLTASDSELSSFDELTVTVAEANVAPVVDAGVDGEVTLPNSLNLLGSVSDDGLPGAPLTTVWSQVSGPGTTTFGDASLLQTTASFSLPGVYVLRLTASDSELSSFDELTVTVAEANVAPVVDAGVDEGVTLPNSLNLSGSVSDDGLPGAPLTSVWSQVSGPGTTTFGDASLLQTTASFSLPGVYVLRLTASDSELSSFDELTVTVAEANVAPVVDAGVDGEVTLPNSLNLLGSVSDDGLPGAPLTTVWSQVSGPGTTTFGDASLLQTTASFSLPGVYVLRLTASDSELSSFDELTVTVAEANVAPVVDAGVDEGVTLPNSLNLSGSVSDDGLPGAPLTTVWSQVSGPGTTTFGDASLLQTTASFSLPGVYVLRLTASDSELSSFDELTVTVAEANVAPVVEAGVDEGVTLPNSLNLSGSVSDDGLPGAPLTTVWSQVSGPGTTTFGDASLLQTTASFSLPGVYVLRLTASDSELSSFDELTVTVAEANVAPVVDAGVDEGVTLPNSLNLSGSVSDDGLPGAPLTTVWSQVSGPGTTTFGDASLLQTTASFSLPGVYVLRLTASDSELSSFDELTVTIAEANVAPVVDAGVDGEVTLPNSLNFLGSVSDDGLPGAPLTTVWSQVSGPGTTTFGDASLLQTTASFSLPGVYVLRLTASDSELSSFDELTVTVAEANVAPVVEAGVDEGVTLPNSLNLSGSVSDDGLPGAPLTTVWSQVSGPGTTTFGDASLLQTTASFSLPGVYVLRLTASDSELSSFDELTVTVAEANVAPVVDAGVDEGVTLPNSLNLSGSVSDDGLPGAPLTTVWSQVSGPGTTTFGDASLLQTTASFSLPGVYVLRLTASDSELSSFDELTVTIAEANVAPVVDAGVDGEVTLPNSLNLLGSVSDDGLPGAPLSTVWSQVSGPGTTTFGDASLLQTTASFSLPGVYVLRLTASDSELSSFDELTVTVAEANVAPVVDAGVDEGVTLPNSLNLSGSVSDDGLPGAPLTTVWSQVSGPGTTTFGDASLLQTTASFSLPGVYVLRLTASDSELSSFDELTVTVAEANVAPVVDAGVDGEVTLPNSLNFLGSVSDDGLPGAPLTTVWSQVSGPGTTTFGDASLLQTTASFSLPGVYVLRLTASDSELSSFDELTVTVAEANVAPVVDAGVDEGVTLPNSLNLSGSVSDDGLPGAPLTTVWSQVSGPGTTTFGDASLLQTTASFSLPGVYVLRLTASDGELSSFDELTVTVAEANVALHLIEVRVSSSEDDAEERANGWTTTNNPDLELVYDGSNQTVGVRFSDLGIPAGATILNAYVQFVTDEASSGVTSLVIHGEGVDNAAAFSATAWNISTRNRTATSINWVPTAWNTVGEAGLAQRTPDLAAVLQEIVDRPGWSAGNSLGLIVTGSGARVAFAHDGNPAAAPLLHVEYSTGGPTANVTPVVEAGADQAVMLPDSLNLSGTVRDDGLPGDPLTTVWSQVSGPGTTTFGDASLLQTTASFSLPGVYVLRLTADDGELSSFDELTVNVGDATLGTRTIEVRVSSSEDDAEERANGWTTTNNPDLELVYDGSNQTVGVRFVGLNLPSGATILNAYVQFQTDEVSSGAAALVIQGENVDDAAAFSTTARSLSSRPRTTASVDWSPVAWNTLGEAGLGQRTPNLASVVQEIVNRPGWGNTSALALIITGMGARIAESYDGDPAAAPLLHVEYISGGETTVLTTDLASLIVSGEPEAGDGGGAEGEGHDRLDVNRDGRISPLDFLLVINQLNRGGGEAESGRAPLQHTLDVNGDQMVSPLDALLVLNYLNRQSAVPFDQLPLAARGSAASLSSAVLEATDDFFHDLEEAPDALGW